ncbi:MAG: hypothetical protein ACLU3F_15275 [Blautia wexlerae]
MRRRSGTEIAAARASPPGSRPQGGNCVIGQRRHARQPCQARPGPLQRKPGVVMTGAGATFPLRPRIPPDSNIRIAPTLPPLELEHAIEIFCTSLRLAALEQQVSKSPDISQKSARTAVRARH